MNVTSGRFKKHVSSMSQRPGGVSEGKARAMMIAARPVSTAKARKHAGQVLPKVPKKGKSAVEPAVMDGNRTAPRRPISQDEDASYE